MELLLLIDQRDSQLQMDGKSLILRSPAGHRRIPLGPLAQVIVAANCQADTRVWRALAERNIAVVMLPGRGRGGTAFSNAALGQGRRYRNAQHRADQQLQCRVAAQIVQLKIAGYRQLMAELGPTPCSEELGLASEAEDPPPEQPLPAQPDSLTHLDGIRGWEGSAARQWYQYLARYLASGADTRHWQFEKRVRRPPTDPVNAMLSLGYTLLQGVAAQAVHAVGLDPAQGILHQPYPGRASLVLDVMEAFRPGVDHMMLSLLPELTLEQFTHSGREGTRLSKDARQLFFNRWADYCGYWPEALSQAADSFRESDSSLLANLIRHSRGIANLLLSSTESSTDLSAQPSAQPSAPQPSTP